MGTLNISQIDPRAFAHPADEKATAALKKIPFLPELLKKVAQLDVEQKFRAQQMFNSIQLGPRQLPSLWRMVHEVAERFGMPEPTAYVSSRGGVNAFAFGLHRHSIILTSSLVDLMTDREIEAIIAHELAHILCQHMLYKNVGLALASGTMSSLKMTPAAFVGDSVSRLLMAWNRSAEYSADRAALLILQDPEALVACLARLAGVPRRFTAEFEPRIFAEQVQEFEEESTFWSKVVTMGMGTFLSHPEPAKRATAVLEWWESAECQNILQGRYLTKTEAEALDRVQIEGVKSCPLCRSPVGQQLQCGHCGLEQDPSRHRQCTNGHLNSVAWKFCKSCGDQLAPAQAVVNG